MAFGLEIICLSNLFTNWNNIRHLKLLLILSSSFTIHLLNFAYDFYQRSIYENTRRKKIWSCKLKCNPCYQDFLLFLQLSQIYFPQNTMLRWFNSLSIMKKYSFKRLFTLSLLKIRIANVSNIADIKTAN